MQGGKYKIMKIVSSYKDLYSQLSDLKGVAGMPKQLKSVATDQFFIP
jgi:hypothetical protein